MGWIANLRLKSLHSPDHEKRARAVAWLGGTLEPERVVFLTEATGDSEALVRANAAAGLGRSGARLIGHAPRRPIDPEDLRVVIDRLFDLLGDGEIAVQAAARQALEQIVATAREFGGAGLVESALVARLEHRSDESRSAAAALLEQMGWRPRSESEQAALDIAKHLWRSSAAHVPALLNVLAGDAAYPRSVAADYLGRSGDARAVDPLVRALRDVNDEVRRNAAQALGKIGDKRAIPALTEALADDRGYVRNWAARALGALEAAEAVEPLVALLETDAADAAAEALGMIGDAKALPGLVAALRSPKPEARRDAALALARIGTSECVPALVECLADEEWSVRSAAVRALGRIGDERAAPAIVPLLGDTEGADLRSEAAEALGSIGSETGIAALVECLADESEKVREAAAKALDAAGDPRGAEALAEAARLAAEIKARAASQPGLKGLIIVFDRDFEPKQTFVDSILDRMEARGRSYRGWMNHGTPLRVLVRANAQQGMAIAAIGSVEFRRMLDEEVDLEKLEYATFEGSHDISGVILSLWTT